MGAEASGPRANSSKSLHQDPPAESLAKDGLLSFCCQVQRPGQGNMRCRHQEEAHPREKPIKPLRDDKSTQCREKLSLAKWLASEMPGMSHRALSLIMGQSHRGSQTLKRIPVDSVNSPLAGLVSCCTGTTKTAL